MSVWWAELGNLISRPLGSGYGDSLRLIIGVLRCWDARSSEKHSEGSSRGPRGRLFWSLRGNLVILRLEAPSLASFSGASAFLPFLLSQ